MVVQSNARVRLRPALLLCVLCVAAAGCKASGDEPSAIESVASATGRPAANSQVSGQEPDMASGDDSDNPRAPGTSPAAARRIEDFHLDDTGSTRLRPALGERGGERAVIRVILESTPSGAMAAVDGATVGRTPTLWSGEVDGKPHEFTFVLPGHAMARYRFVPTTDGIVHGELHKLPDSDEDAGP